MAYEYTDDTLGILNQIAAPATTSAVPQLYAQEPVGALSASPLSTTGYPGGDAWAQGLAAAYAANPAALTSMMSTPYDWTFNLSSNKGNPTGEVAVGKDTPIMLVDNRTGEVVSSGIGVDAAKAIHDAAANLTNTLGRKANWSIYTAPAGATSADQYSLVANEKPNQSTLGEIADVALPAALAAIPGLNVLGAAAAAAGGPAATSLAQGRSLQDTLTRAALAGGATYAGGSLFGPSSTGAATAGKSIANTVKDAALNNSIGGALSGVGSIATPLTSAQIANLTSGLTLPSVGGALGGAAAPIAATEGAPIVVTGTVPSALGGAGVGGALGGALGPIIVDGVLGNEMILTGQTQQPTKPDTTLPVPDFSGVGPISQPLTPGQIADATTPSTGGTTGVGTLPSGGAPSSTLNNISDWLKLAGIVSTLGGALGGGGSSSGTRPVISGGMSGLNPVFGGTLPSANLPGAAGRTPRDMSGTDWNRYAFGPEKSFFSDVPRGLAKGGTPDGRSDDIPAMLSNNEYVIDAETMALLGNGDPQAGADRMDEWRVNVRKHKGRELARGAISRDAKMPEQYLGGGRV